MEYHVNLEIDGEDWGTNIEADSPEEAEDKAFDLAVEQHPDAREIAVLDDAKPMGESLSTDVVRSLLETGEPDQDYDHEFYDAVVDALAKGGLTGATHREFDKYQGVYLSVPGVGTFWVKEVYYRNIKSDEPVPVYVMFEEDNPDYTFELEQDPDGTVDVSPIYKYADMAGKRL